MIRGTILINKWNERKNSVIFKYFLNFYGGILFVKKVFTKHCDISTISFYYYYYYSDCIWFIFTSDLVEMQFDSTLKIDSKFSKRETFEKKEIPGEKNRKVNF